MKTIIDKYIKSSLILLVLAGLLITSCSKDDYYVDGGKANPAFNGTVMDYLESNPTFDTIAQIVKLAGMEEMFRNEEITFFAPTDEVVRRTIGNATTGLSNSLNLNMALYRLGKDTIKTLSDVDPQIWRKYLMRYVFKGKRVLKDFPQIDFDLRQLYPGSYYYTYNNDLTNIGVVYNKANGVKYTGYRQLAISFINDQSSPDNFITAAVASSDIQPKNGVVHALAVWTGTIIIVDGNAQIIDKIGETRIDPASNYFGFGFDFSTEVVLSK